MENSQKNQQKRQSITAEIKSIKNKIDCMQKEHDIDCCKKPTNVLKDK